MYVKSVAGAVAVLAAASAVHANNHLEVIYDKTDGGQCSGSTIDKYMSLPMAEACTNPMVSHCSPKDGEHVSTMCSQSDGLLFPSHATSSFMQIRYFEDAACTTGKGVAVGTAMNKCMHIAGGKMFSSYMISGDLTQITMQACTDSACSVNCVSDSLPMYTNAGRGNCSSETDFIQSFSSFIPDEVNEILSSAPIRAASIQILQADGTPLA